MTSEEITNFIFIKKLLITCIDVWDEEIAEKMLNLIYFFLKTLLDLLTKKLASPPFNRKPLPNFAYLTNNWLISNCEHDFFWFFQRILIRFFHCNN